MCFLTNKEVVTSIFYVQYTEKKLFNPEHVIDSVLYIYI